MPVIVPAQLKEVKTLQINISEITYTAAYWILLAPIIGAAFDIFTGWIQASVNGVWDSTKMRKGLYRKSGELAVVLLGYVAEMAVAAAAQVHLATFLSLYICVMEFISILENLDQAGIMIPSFIKERLGKIKENADKGE